jgi:hypothetical protein
VRIKEYPSGHVRDFYSCEGCGQVYPTGGDAESCERLHAPCPHPPESRRWHAAGGHIDRQCAACGAWFHDGDDLSGLTDDQPTLARLVEAIRAAKKGGGR